MSWKYELRAKVVNRNEEEHKVFKLQARQKVDQVIEFPLPFSEQYNGQTVKLNMIPNADTSAQFLKNTVKIAGGL